MRYSGCSGVGVVRAVVRSDISIVFNEICALVVLIRNRVQVLDFVGQTESQTLCSSRPGSYRGRFV